MGGTCQFCGRERPALEERQVMGQFLQLCPTYEVFDCFRAARAAEVKRLKAFRDKHAK